MLTDDLDKISAVWYDSPRAHTRCLAVRLNNGKLTVMSREKPSDVWSPPKQMFLTGIHTIPSERIPDNPDLARDIERGK